MMNRSAHRQWLSDQSAIVEPAAFRCDVRAHDAVICFSEQIFSCLAAAFDVAAHPQP